MPWNTSYCMTVSLYGLIHSQITRAMTLNLGASLLTAGKLTHHLSELTPHLSKLTHTSQQLCWKLFENKHTCCQYHTGTSTPHTFHIYTLTAVGYHPISWCDIVYIACKYQGTICTSLAHFTPKSTCCRNLPMPFPTLVHIKHLQKHLRDSVTKANTKEIKYFYLFKARSVEHQPCKPLYFRFHQPECLHSKLDMYELRKQESGQAELHALGRQVCNVHD